MSLHDESVALRGQVKQMLGEKMGVVTKSIDTLKASGIAERAAHVGQLAPDFTLPDAYGKQVSLSSLLQKGPVVLCFYRGSWCPFCNLELHAYQQVLPRINSLGATLVAISPEKPDYAEAMAVKQKLAFPVLSDLGNKVARAYGLVFAMTPEMKDVAHGTFNVDLAAHNGDRSGELPIPATFVIDAQRTIRYAHVDPDFMTGRANPEDALAALRSIKEPQLTSI
jgi:peroxiredoxin